MLLDERAQFGLEIVGLTGEQADAADEFAGDPHARAGREPAPRASDTVQLDQAVERACGQFGFKLRA